LHNQQNIKNVNHKKKPTANNNQHQVTDLIDIRKKQYINNYKNVSSRIDKTAIVTLAEQEQLLLRAKNMFYHAYDSYMHAAFPHVS
jgi:hypothetical protein